MRLFIGIQLSEDIKNYLYDVQSKIKHCAISGNYTMYDNFHLTLRFLGEINESEVDTYCDILAELKKENAFQISIGDIHSFNRNNRHIVYVDVIKYKQLVINLANRLDKIIFNYLGNQRKEKFKPHITISRNVVFSHASTLNQVVSFAKEITIDSVSLMLSKRNKQNILTYTPIYTVKLKNLV